MQYLAVGAGLHIQHIHQLFGEDNLLLFSLG